ALVFVPVRLPAQNRTSSSQRQAAGETQSIESLRSRLAAHLNQTRFDPASWGVKVVSLDTGKTLFEQNSQKLFSPASNAKLYTSALALDRLGPDFKVRTSLYSASKPDSSGTVRGDLVVYGRGDPLMTARLNEGDYFKPLDPLVSTLVNNGVRKIDGDVIGDNSYFTGPPFGAGWEWDDLQADYGAEVSALSVEDNCVDLFVKPAERVGLPCAITMGPDVPYLTIMNRTQTTSKGTETRVTVYRPVGENIVYVTGRVPIDGSGYYSSVAVHKPAAYFATVFKEALLRRGIAVTGRARSVDWRLRESTPINFSRLFELGAIDSSPLKDIIRETLKPSQDMYAQLLLLHIGKAAEEASKPESTPPRATNRASIKPRDRSASNRAARK